MKRDPGTTRTASSKAVEFLEIVVMCLVVLSCDNRIERLNNELAELRELKHLELAYEGQSEFPYECSGDKERQVFGGYASIKVGDKASNVLLRLGRPDAVEGLASNQHEFFGSHVVYYLRKQRDGLSTDGDQSISLTFDKAGQLVSATVHGIDVLKDKGG